MSTTLSGYQRDIVKATKCRPQDAEQIEEVMRTETGGVLDHLTASRFNNLAKITWEVVKELRKDNTYPTPE